MDIPLPYIDQVIPSPVGMPVYKSFSFPHSQVVDNPSLDSFATAHANVPFVDMAGQRVKSYMQHILLNQKCVALLYYMSSPTRGYALQSSIYCHCAKCIGIVKAHHPICVL